MTRARKSAARLVAFFQRLRERRAQLLLSLIAFVFCTAPTPGDIGGCGQRPQELDPGIFFVSKAAIDCQRCTECGLASKSCTNACNDDPASYPNAFPDRCLPLVHDGEVCLRALSNASCSDYADYMSDQSPTVPTECDFCPEPPP
ncbi:MAG TPA: hypothetical protein VHV51_14505 [Polyangiaceae bacterium]|jgi:hypothetical protein|nr:hypothetical protein [Polyangiaceae bacterium]